jgi:hypothetical protein
MEIAGEKIKNHNHEWREDRGFRAVVFAPFVVVESRALDRRAPYSLAEVSGLSGDAKICNMKYVILHITYEISRYNRSAISAKPY